MAENDRSQILAFLYKIIDDNQATIRFLDTKAAFGIAVLGAMVGKMLDTEELAAVTSHGAFILFIAVAFALSLILAAFLGYKTVFPTVNPAQNVSFPDNLQPKFFISKFSRKSFWRLFSSNKNFAMLEETHPSYCAAVSSAAGEKIESIVAAEVLKLSFIRQLKTDRLTGLAKVLIVTVVLFIFLMIAAPKSTPAPALQGPRVEGTQGIYTLSANPKECTSPPQAVSPKVKPPSKPSPK